MYTMKQFRINQDGSKEVANCYVDAQTRAEKIFTDRAQAESTAKMLNDLPSTDSSSLRWEVVPIRLDKLFPLTGGDNGKRPD